MPAYVALLRGINVGKAKRVPMATLRQLLADLGHADVQTLLNSGNAVFQAQGTSGMAHAKDSASAIASVIALAISKALGFEVPVVVKSAKDWALIVQDNPFVDRAEDPARLLVAVTHDASMLTGLKAIESLVSAPEAFHVGSRAAYLHCPAGILQSKAAVALLGKVGQAVTTRNWATTLKIQALLASSSA